MQGEDKKLRGGVWGVGSVGGERGGKRGVGCSCREGKGGGVGYVEGKKGGR